MAQEGYIDYSEGGHGRDSDGIEAEYPMLFALIYFLILFGGVLVLVL